MSEQEEIVLESEQIEEVQQEQSAIDPEKPKKRRKRRKKEAPKQFLSLRQLASKEGGLDGQGKIRKS